MIRNGYRNHRRLGQSSDNYTQGACPPGLIQNQDNCVPAVYAPQASPVVLSPGQIAANQAAAIAGQQIPYPTLTVLASGSSYNPGAMWLPTTPAPSPAAPIPVTPAPVSPAPLTTPLPPSTAPANYSAEEIAGSFNYTADLETVQNEMALYGDTWDNAQTIVNSLYSSGIVPGTVTPAIAFSMLTGLLAATTTTAPASLLSSVSTWPWYYWAALAGGGLLLLSGGSGRK